MADFDGAAVTCAPRNPSCWLSFRRGTGSSRYSSFERPHAESATERTTPAIWPRCLWYTGIALGPSAVTHRAPDGYACTGNQGISGNARCQRLGARRPCAGQCLRSFERASRPLPHSPWSPPFAPPTPVTWCDSVTAEQAPVRTSLAVKEHHLRVRLIGLLHCC